MLLSAVLCLTSFAEQKEEPHTAAFPYTIVFDVDSCGRLCYAGHRGQGIAYHDGLAVTPDTTFRVERLDHVDGVSDELYDLSMDISLIYENEEQNGFQREVLRRFETGDLTVGEEYPVFSENTVESLEKRGKLYSDSLRGYEITLSYHSRETRKKKFYMYVCSSDEFSDYLENSDYQFADPD